MAAHHSKPRYTVHQLGVFLLLVALGALGMTAWRAFVSFIWAAL